MNDTFMPPFPFRSYLLCAGLLLGGVLMTSCGKKGPLYLPDDAPKKTAEPAAVPASPLPQK